MAMHIERRSDRPGDWDHIWPPAPRSTLVVMVAVMILGRAAYAAEKRHPLEPVDHASPRATLTGFIDKANEIYRILQAREESPVEASELAQREEHLLRCLDLSETPDYLREYAGKEAAVCLKEVFDRIELPAPEEIPDYKAVKAEAGTDVLERWTIPHTDISIVKLIEGPRKGDYVFRSPGQSSFTSGSKTCRTGPITIRLPKESTSGFCPSPPPRHLGR